MIKSCFYKAIESAVDLVCCVKDIFVPLSEKDVIRRTVDLYIKFHPYLQERQIGKSLGAADRDFIYLTGSYYKAGKADFEEKTLYDVLQKIHANASSPENAIAHSINDLYIAHKNNKDTTYFRHPGNNHAILWYFRQIALEKGALKTSPFITWMDNEIERMGQEIKTYRTRSFEEMENYKRNLKQTQSIRKACMIPLLSLIVFCGLHSLYSQGIGESLLRNTLFHALRGQRILEEQEKNAEMSLIEQIWAGASTSLEGLAFYILKTKLIDSVTGLFTKEIESSKKPKYDLLSQPLHESIPTYAIKAPIAEEIAFRGLIQNGLRITLSALSHIPYLGWTSSPTLPILGAQTAFALAHWQSGSGEHSYTSRQEAIVKMINLLLQPELSILHATTGGLTASIPNHIVRNTLAFLIG